MDQFDTGIYVVQEAGQPYVKLGVSDRIRDRINDLQIGNPRELILIAAYWFAGSEYEAQEHERFKRWRVRGEWFILSPVLARILLDEYSIMNWTPEFNLALLAFYDESRNAAEILDIDLGYLRSG